MLLENLDWETKVKINRLVVLYKKTERGIPVDINILVGLLEKIINKKIEVRFGKIERPACIFPFPKRFLILIRLSDCLKNQRLNLVHELAHIFISYTDDDQSKIKWPILDNEDRICDEVGTYFLCPPTEVEKFLKNEFNTLPHQLELFRKIQKPLDITRLERLELMSEIFEVPLKYLVRYLKKTI